MFITNERLDIIKEKNIQGAPDLVMEVLSPGTAYYDLRHKKDVYAEQGVREYWIVDPMERSIEVYTNRDGGFEQVDFVKQKGRVDSRVFSKLFVSAPELFGV